MRALQSRHQVLQALTKLREILNWIIKSTRYAFKDSGRVELLVCRGALCIHLLDEILDERNDKFLLDSVRRLLRNHARLHKQIGVIEINENEAVIL